MVSVAAKFQAASVSRRSVKVSGFQRTVTLRVPSFTCVFLRMVVGV